MPHGTHNLYKSDLRSPTLWPSSVFVKKFITVRNWANSINSSRLTESPLRRPSVEKEMHCSLGNVWNYMDLYGIKKWHLFYKTIRESCDSRIQWLLHVRWCLFLRMSFLTLSATLDHAVAISVEETCEPLRSDHTVSVVNTQIFLQKSNGHKMANSRPSAFLFSHLHCVFLEIPLAARKHQNKKNRKHSRKVISATGKLNSLPITPQTICKKIIHFIPFSRLLSLTNELDHWQQLQRLQGTTAVDVQSIKLFKARLRWTDHETLPIEWKLPPDWFWYIGLRDYGEVFGERIKYEMKYPCMQISMHARSTFLVPPPCDGMVPHTQLVLC